MTDIRKNLSLTDHKPSWYNAEPIFSANFIAETFRPDDLKGYRVESEMIKICYCLTEENLQDLFSSVDNFEDNTLTIKRHDRNGKLLVTETFFLSGKPTLEYSDSYDNLGAAELWLAHKYTTCHRKFEAKTS